MKPDLTLDDAAAVLLLSQGPLSSRELALLFLTVRRLVEQGTIDVDRDVDAKFVEGITRLAAIEQQLEFTRQDREPVVAMAPPFPGAH